MPSHDARRRFIARLARAIDGRMRGSTRASPLVRPGERVLVACSGGADSAALAAGLAELAGRRRRGFSFVLAHLDHGLRSADEAAGDRAAIQELAAALGTRAVLGRAAELRDAARREGHGLEAAARAARYGFLAAAAAAEGAARVAVGHTRDDQVETILLRLVRGAGLRGLAGMPLRRPLGGETAIAGAPPAAGAAHGEDLGAKGANPHDRQPQPIELVRPLLAIERAEVLAYLDARGLPFRDDPTNRDPAFALRNRVRHELVPLLQALRPGAGEALLRLARSAAAGDRALRAAAEAALDAAASSPGAASPAPPVASAREPTVRLAVPALRALDDEVLAVTLSIAVERAFGVTLGARHLDALTGLVRGGSGARADLPRGLGARRERAWLRVERLGAAPAAGAGPVVPTVVG